MKRLRILWVFFVLFLLGVSACGEPKETPLRVSVSGLMDLVNGWNNVSDNNRGKTFGTQMAWASGKTAVVQNWMGGPEHDGRSGGWRHLLDTTFVYSASDRLVFMVNHDYAFDDTGSGTVKWTGAAVYARYVVNPGRTFTLRYEWFRDRDGASTGTAQILREITLTYEVKVRENFLVRYETRRDWSSQAVFPKNSGFSRKQTTLLVGTVVLF
ncbi:MAG: outer membrane beta-barrel protein [Armatimonadota bacterium]